MADNIEIGDLVARISFDDTGLNKSMAEIDRQMKIVKSEFDKASSSLQGYGNEEDKLKAKSDSLNQQLQLQQQRVNKLNEEFQRSAQEKGEDARETQNLAVKLNQAQTAYNNLDTELQEVNKALAAQKAEVTSAQSAWSKMGDSMSAAGEKLKDAGKKITDVGKTLSLSVTAPLVALGTLSAKAAIDFESAFAGVRKTVDATEEEFAAFEAGIRDMSKTMPAAATEIASVAEAAGQLGIEKDVLLDFTKTMVNLGVATNMGSEDAAMALARLANITQMPQKNFDRLGATIVGLGNNLATTESEIVEMGLRLAGAGKQVGMTEDQILALAGAMSSVGIEAEAGGTAMSRVMIEMASAVSAGGDYLRDFAGIAGMSSEEFTKAWGEDASSALVSFIEGLRKFADNGEDIFGVLDYMGLSEIRVRDTLLRASGAGDLFRNSLELASEAWRENTALTDEANERYKTTASQMAMLKNQLIDLGIQLGKILVPIIKDVISAITPVIEKFAKMDTATQKVILTIAGIAAAIGPVIIVIGTLVSSIGSIVSVVGAASAAIGAAGGITAALGAAFTALTGPVGLIIAGIAAVTAGGIALYKHLKKDAIPEIDRFGDEVSESTQQAVGGFLDLHDSATTALNELSWSGKAVTAEMASELVSTFDKMGDQILVAMQEDHAAQISTLQQFFATSTALTEEEEAKAIAAAQKGQEDRALAIQEGQDKIAEILNAASEERRALTATEMGEINRIQTEMVETGIAVLSESQLEQKAIMERMAANADELSARQAADVVKNSIAQRDGAVSAAEEQYNDIIKEIIRQRDEAGSISAEQADRLIADAQRQRDETVQLAEGMHSDILAAARTKAGEYTNLVDWETGEVLKKWQVYWNKLQNWQDAVDNHVKEAWNSMIGTIKAKLDDIKAAVTNKFKEIGDWFNGLPDQYKQIGIDIMTGLINGIKSMSSAVANTAKEVAESIGKGIKKVLGINSPSKVTTQLGVWTGEGLAIGMDKTSSLVAQQAAKLSAAAVPNISQPNAGSMGGVAAGQNGNMFASGVESLSQTINVPVYLDGKQIAIVTAQPQASMARISARGMGMA